MPKTPGLNWYINAPVIPIVTIFATNIAKHTDIIITANCFLEMVTTFSVEEDKNKKNITIKFLAKIASQAKGTSNVN